MFLIIPQLYPLSHEKALQISAGLNFGGDKEIRTLDPLLAKQVLYQLSYTPIGTAKVESFFIIPKKILKFC